MTDAPKPPPIPVPLSAEEKKSIKQWQWVLVGLGLLVVGLAFLLQYWAIRQTTVTTVDKTATKTVTTTAGTAIPSTLVTTCLGGGVVLLLAGCFYGRITKISWNGAEVDLSGTESADVKDVAGKVAGAKAPKDAVKQKLIEDRSVAFAQSAKALTLQGVAPQAVAQLLGVSDQEVAAQSEGSLLTRTAVAAAVKSVGLA